MRLFWHTGRFQPLMIRIVSFDFASISKIITFIFQGIITRPNCHQVYNLFHPTDPVAARLEPLLSARFSILPPINVARYAKYPLGDGQPYHLRKYATFL